MRTESQIMNGPQDQVTTPQNRLEPMLIRLPPTLASRLRALAHTTRVRQSDYLREAVSDLLAKYQHIALDEADAH